MICVGVMLLTCIIFAGDQVPAKDSSGYLHLPVLRSRVPSYHMRELARGQFMVKSKDITLLASPTRGPCLYYMCIIYKCFVFRGVWNSLQGQTEDVQ